MVRSKTVRLSFTANVDLEDRIDHWSAYIDPLGMTVYGNTEEEVKDRVGKAMQFFLTTFVTSTDGVERVRRYLDSH